MDVGDMQKLMGLLTAYEGRRPTELLFEAWMDVAREQKWTYELADQAMRRLKRREDTPRYLQPYDVGAEVNRLRGRATGQPPIYQPRQLTEPPATEGTRAALMQEMRSYLPQGRAPRRRMPPGSRSR